MAAIKQDPEANDKYMDDEFYEDTGELSMPTHNGDDVWLTRIPDWLYSSISQWDELAEGNDNDHIQLGEVVAFATTTGIDKTRPMRMFLSDAWREKTKLPTAYEIEPIQTSDQVLGNTYIFTEKDLPGYRPTGYGYGGYGNRGPAVQDPKSRVQKRSRYKKAIPKHTALIGHATRHYAANPIATKEYNAFSAARIKQAIQGSNMKTIITKDTDVTNYNNLQKRFESFIRPTNKAKAQQNKASRVSKEELRDMLHSAFDEYQYWPMKALKARTRQPESFLKEGLQELAQLVKSGSFASTWQRLPMYSEARNLSQQQQGAAAAPEGADAGDSDGEDEMEDVV
jgi:transcription initiation factor TFIIF subunit beta